MNTENNYMYITEDNNIDITLEGDDRYGSKLTIITEDCILYVLAIYCMDWLHETQGNNDLVWSKFLENSS